MTTRRFGGLTAAALLLAAATFFGFAPFGQTEDKKPAPAAHNEHHEAMMACAKACSDCQRVCDSCSAHCAHMLREGMKEHHTTLMTCQDCASVCAAASQIVARGGPFSATICAACADVCGKCAAACEKFPNDPHMKQCADECRKCEKACKDMVQHTGGK